MTDLSDIEDLIARGNLELADGLCDAVLNCLLGLKHDIATRRMSGPSIGGNISVGLEDSLGSSVLNPEISRQCLISSGIGGCRCSVSGSVDRERCMFANVSMMAAEK